MPGTCAACYALHAVENFLFQGARHFRGNRELFGDARHLNRRCLVLKAPPQIFVCIRLKIQSPVTTRTSDRCEGEELNKSGWRP